MKTDAINFKTFVQKNKLKPHGVIRAFDMQTFVWGKDGVILAVERMLPSLNNEFQVFPEDL